MVDVCVRVSTVNAMSEYRAHLPFTFDHDDYVQLLTDIATKLAPELGWSPA